MHLRLLPFFRRSVSFRIIYFQFVQAVHPAVSPNAASPPEMAFFFVTHKIPLQFRILSTSVPMLFTMKYIFVSALVLHKHRTIDELNNRHMFLNVCTPAACNDECPFPYAPKKRSNLCQDYSIMFPL